MKCPVCYEVLDPTEDGRWEHPEPQPWAIEGYVGCPHQDDWLSEMDMYRLDQGLGLAIDED